MLNLSQVGKGGFIKSVEGGGGEYDVILMSDRVPVTSFDTKVQIFTSLTETNTRPITRP